MNILCSPHTEDIETYLGTKDIIHKRYLHLTPTLILFRRRVRYYANTKSIKNELKNNPLPPEMSPADKIHKYVDVYEINQYVKTLSQKREGSVLNKAEATVLLERILSSNPATNNPSWSSVMLELFDLFATFSLSGATPVSLRAIDSSAKWQLVFDLYDSYLTELEKLNVSDGALMSRKQLEALDVTPYTELLLDGAFLPFTPTLKILMEKFKEQNKPVIHLLPFDLDQSEHPAQKAITDVYNYIEPKVNWTSIKDQSSESFFIKRLPKLIFQNKKPTNIDTSLQLLRFHTLEEELHYIMQTISTLLKHKRTTPEQIVLITPDAMAIRPLVREISEQYNLRVHLPKRPLLHLNQGRAIKHLFDMRVDQRREADTYFTSKHMKVFLNDSILKHSPRILNAYEKIEGFFEDCISISDFATKIIALIHAKGILDDKHDQHPLRHIRLEQLEELRNICYFLNDISQSLVGASAARVSEHVQRLISCIQSNNNFRELEEEIWERIQSISKTTITQRNLIISGAEFGERVAALFNEGEDFEPGEEPVEDETDVELKREILVTGPNNVEFQRYDYVFLCRFTQDMYPEPKRYNWLLTKQIECALLQHTTDFKVTDTKALDRFYLDRGMYHVYLALCAPRTQLTISYAQMDNGQPLTPAHYLHDIAKTFGIEEGNRLINKKESSLEQLLEQHWILKSPSKYLPVSDYTPGEQPIWHLTERTFTAEDVAIYQYCPRRFYYQSKHEEHHVFDQLFHLQSYTTSCLYEKTVELFVQGESFPLTEIIDTKKQLKRLLAVIIKRREEAESLVHPLFPLSYRHWHNIRIQTDFHLQSLLQRIFDGDFIREYRKRGNASIKVSMSIANQDDIIQLGDFHFTSIRELEVQYLGLETHRYSISNKKDILSFSSSDFDEKEMMEEMKRWYTTFKREFKKRTPAVMGSLAGLVEAISTGAYPKRTGGHCMYCSFNKICREREVDSC